MKEKRKPSDPTKESESRRIRKELLSTPHKPLSRFKLARPSDEAGKVKQGKTTAKMVKGVARSDSGSAKAC
jgi:hypothetical protein